MLNEVKEKTKLPKYVRLNMSELRLKDNTYYRDAGYWGVGYRHIDGKLVSWIPNAPWIHNVELIEITEKVWRKANKAYLLKLEHKDYSPIVFKLDSLPRLVNTDNYKNKKADNSSPRWIKNYLKSESITLAFIDHQKLFDQIIKTQ